MNILYIHGLQSSGQSGTADRLRQMLPKAKIFSPDIPVEADAAVTFIKNFVQDNNIGLVIGTSMGGMLAQLLRGIPKIIVNPSFHVSSSMRKKIGIVPFYSPRADGATEYEITLKMCDTFEKIEKNQFANIAEFDMENTYGLFGTNDDVVNCQDEYLKHYTNCQTMVCGHRLTEEAVREYLIPLIKLMEKNMEQEKNEQIRFEYSGWNNIDVTCFGIHELEGKRGVNFGEKMAMFWGKGYEMYVVNTETGKLRKFSDAAGHVLVSPEDIDLESIKRHCPEGLSNAKSRILEYAHMNRYTDFENGVAAISWTLYPDGRYFEDEDGFGGESNNEETVYCVINRDLEIIRPFAYVPDVKAMLKEVANSSKSSI